MENAVKAPRTREYEIVSYKRIKHINVFAVNISYRNLHFHDALEIALILKGKGSVRTKGNTYTVEEGDIWFFNVYEIHEIFNSNLEILGMQISPGFLREYCPSFKNLEYSTENIKKLDNEQKNTIASLMKNIASSYYSDRECYELEVLMDTIRLLLMLRTYLGSNSLSDKQDENRRKNSGRMKEISDYIDAHISDKIRLEDVGNHIGLSTYHLSHYFRKYFGVSFQEYVTSERLEKAVRLLMGTDDGLIEIAYECGFSDLKYMNQAFVKVFGCKPKEFKAKNRYILQQNSIEGDELEYLSMQELNSYLKLIKTD